MEATKRKPMSIRKGKKEISLLLDSKITGVMMKGTTIMSTSSWQMSTSSACPLHHHDINQPLPRHVLLYDFLVVQGYRGGTTVLWKPSWVYIKLATPIWQQMKVRKLKILEWLVMRTGLQAENLQQQVKNMTGVLKWYLYRIRCLKKITTVPIINIGIVELKKWKQAEKSPCILSQSLYYFTIACMEISLISIS